MDTNTKLPDKHTLPVFEFFQQHIIATLFFIIWILYFWELYLNIRQRKLMKKLVEPPQSLDGLISADIYKKSRKYALDKNSFSIVHDFYSNVINSVIMCCSGLYYYWIWGCNVTEFVGLNKNNELWASAGCVVVMLFTSKIMELPFSIYGTFVLEERHGFNNQTWLFYIRDQTLKFFVYLVLVVPLTCSMIWIVHAGGDYFFFYLWIFTVVMSLLLMIIYPEVIAPLFDKYSPLPDGDLKQRIEALASSLNYPLSKIFIVDGSKRSSHSNAYLYGFHKNKRIVLFDTLVAEYYKPPVTEGDKEGSNNEEKPQKGCETDEIIAVLAHELGHWHHSHTLKNFFFAQISFVCNFLPFALLIHYAPIYEAFDFTEEMFPGDKKPVLIGLMIVTMYVLAPFNTLIGWFTTVYSRKFEFQADKYAQTLGHAEPLKRALVKLHKDNLGYPIFDELYSGWHHSHPPLLERIEALNKDK